MGKLRIQANPTNLARIKFEVNIVDIIEELCKLKLNQICIKILGLCLYTNGLP